MMMREHSKRVALDIETDDLNATRIWVICTEDIDTGETDTFLNVSHIEEERDRLLAYVSGIDTVQHSHLLVVSRLGLG